MVQEYCSVVRSLKTRKSFRHTFHLMLGGGLSICLFIFPHLVRGLQGRRCCICTDYIDKLFVILGYTKKIFTCLFHNNFPAWYTLSFISTLSCYGYGAMWEYTSPEMLKKLILLSLISGLPHRCPLCTMSCPMATTVTLGLRGWRSQKGSLTPRTPRCVCVCARAWQCTWETWPYFFSLKHSKKWMNTSTICEETSKLHQTPCIWEISAIAGV